MKMVKLKKYKSCVYFISDGEYIKIGLASNVFQRLSSIQCHNARPLELLGIICGDECVERKHHIKFKKYKVRGEWFVYHKDIVDYISTNKDELLLKIHKEEHRNLVKDAWGKCAEKTMEDNIDNLFSTFMLGFETDEDKEIADMFRCGPYAFVSKLKTDDEESLFNDLNIIEKIKEDVPIGPGRKK